MKQAVCAFILNPATGKVLLTTRRNSSQVGLPGGKVDAGESLIEAVRREVKEETGLVLPSSVKPIFTMICDGDVPYETTTFFAVYYGGYFHNGIEDGIISYFGDVSFLLNNSPFAEYNSILLDQLPIIFDTI